MATRPRSSPSFFGGLRARELGGGRVPLPRASAARLPYLADLSSDPGGRGSGVIAVEHAGDPAIPFAISFCKVSEPGIFCPPFVFMRFFPDSDIERVKI